MVTKTFKFSVKIPNSVYRYRWDNIKKYSRYLFKSRVCSECGTKLLFKRPEVTYKGLTVSMNTNRDLCPRCVGEMVMDEALQPSFGDKFLAFDLSEKCDCCGETVTAYKSFNVRDNSLRFCYQGVWNAGRICRNCVTKALMFGEQRSSFYTSYRVNGSFVMVPTNEFGLPVYKGQVRFPT